MLKLGLATAAFGLCKVPGFGMPGLNLRRLPNSQGSSQLTYRPRQTNGVIGGICCGICDYTTYHKEIRNMGHHIGSIWGLRSIAQSGLPNVVAWDGAPYLMINIPQ